MKSNISLYILIIFLSVINLHANSDADIINKPFSPTMQLSQLSLDDSKEIRSDVKKVLHLSESIDHCRSPRALICQLEEINYIKISNDLRIHIVLLVAVLEKTVFFSQMALLKSLDIIENHLVYWREQGNHTVRYFLNKSPSKIVFGEEQHKEIANNIHHLERIQKRYYALLGALNEQLHQFDTTATVEKQFSWLFDMVTMINKMPFVESKDTVTKDLIGIINPVRTILHRLPRYEMSINNVIDSAKMSGYFTVKNCIVAIAGCALIYSYFKNQNYYHVLGNTAKQGSETFYSTNIEGPVGRAYTAVFGYKEGDGLAYAKDRYRAMKAHVAPYPMNNDQKAAHVESHINTVKAHFIARHALAPTAFPAWSEDLEIEVRRLANEFNPHFLRMSMIESVGLLQGLPLINFSEIPGVNLFVREAETPTKLSSVSTLVSIGTLYADLLWGIVGNVGGDASIDRDVDGMIAYLQHLSNQLQLTVALLAFVPTIGLGWGAWKVAKKVYGMCAKTVGYDFRQTRFVLHDLHKLLVENSDKYMAQIDYVGQGKLLYYVYKLKQDVRKYMRYDQSGRFMQDVEALASLKLSNYQKIEIIHGIWNTFTAIRPGYKPEYV